MTRDEPLRPSDVEAEYGIAAGTLKSWRRLTREGKPVGPPSFYMGPRRVVYLRSQVDAWVVQQQQAAS